MTIIRPEDAEDAVEAVRPSKCTRPALAEPAKAPNEAPAPIAPVPVNAPEESQKPPDEAPAPSALDGLSAKAPETPEAPAPAADRTPAPQALSRKQQAFVREYLLDLNATAAYKRAGYKCTGRAAENAASRMLGFVGVKAAINAALAERNQRTEITADLVVQETWTTYQEAREAGKFSAAVTALHLLGKHAGAFPEKHEHSGPDGGAIPIFSIIRFNRYQPAKLPGAVPGGEGS